MRSQTIRIFVVSAIAALSFACGSDDGGSFANIANLTMSERTWVDASRDLPRTPSRSLRVVLWDPGLDERLPLLLLAHGFGGLPEKLDAFARAVAAAGYFVAAPAFPLTNENAPGGHERGLSDYPNQPGDISFVINRILEANDDESDSLFARIDSEQIALLGHSLGGLTALAASRKDCCRDTRIDAVIAVAPLVALFLVQFGNDPITDGPPTLIVHGQADSAIGFQSFADLYEQIAPPRILVGLAETGHSELLESQTLPGPPSRLAAQDATISFLDAVFRGRSPVLETTLNALVGSGHLVERDLPGL